MAMLSKRSSALMKAGEHETKASEPNPKAALMAMMNKRTTPASLPDRTSDMKGLSGAKNDELNEQMCSQAIDSPAIRDDPRFVKYFKMLKMVNQ